MSEAMSAQGTYISNGVGSPPTYTELAEVVTIGGPTEAAEEIDVTHLRSPGAYREFIPSFKDGGELPLTLNFIPSNATQDSVTGLRSEFQTNPPPTNSRRITFPDGTTCTFDAWVKSVGTAMNVGDKIALNVTLRITGPTAWVEA